MILAAAGRLGVTSFGGPIAHIGYFHDEYVARRGWLDEQSFADLVALCQFLPGPASSQLGIAIGMRRGGILGGLAAWLGFTLPSAAALVVFSRLAYAAPSTTAGWLHGLLVIAVAVVAQAVWNMARTLAPDAPRASMAVAAAVVSLALLSTLTQVLLIAAGALVGLIALRPPVEHQEHGPGQPALASRAWRVGAVASLAVFGALLAGLPILRALVPSTWTTIADGFFRTGSLVFGGGHVVLPLLQREVVPSGLTTNAVFLAGYGAAQAVPGPLFTFAAYLGAVIAPNPIAGAALALGAIYLPSFLLLTGVLPFWDLLRRQPAVRSAVTGVNAAVVGILLAALYTPVWTTAIAGPLDVALALSAFLLLALWKVRPWMVVLGGAAVGELLGLLL